MKGKLIVIEGTDCSGKETQTKALIERLNGDGIKCVSFSFPNYDSPTGKIVGGPYLGKSYICDGWFEEGAGNVNPKVAALYYAADRLYNIDTIMEKYKMSLEYNDELPARYTYIYSISGVIGIMGEWIESGFAISSKKLAKMVLQMCVKATRDVK